MSEVEHLVGSQCQLGEGPLWHPVEQVLYWLDITQGRLHRFDPSSGEHQVTILGVVTGSMGVRAQGGFIMATQNGFAFWDPQMAKMNFLGDPDADEADVRFNDGKTDPQGRFWAGKMSTTPTNSLFRLDADCSIQRMESGIFISNGLGWSPDNRIFYYTDSGTKEIYAYDFDPSSGSIANRRVFARIPDAPGEGTPDGLAVDREGCIWSARWGGWKIVRYTPDGRIEREIPMPVEFPTSCAFGGPELNELFITSAWVEVKPANRASQPMAGDVFRLRVHVQGFPEPVFAG
ncbi:MAG: SMP-30/gluconolactonase/LRE family protein [Anaerolineaceae bacterium]|nr:SMP-30/gluconolactonase/LRE family protein [Anaerolineaceae bacterium]